MGNIAIKVENLSKAYQLGEIGTGTMSRDIERWWARLRGKEDPFLKVGETNDRSKKGSSDVVWSLKDINFEIEQGDAVGIIGRNGAGKSTLLKILSKVTSPTAGKISGKGRIASLLEVGTGFHPELTGRENIYLNGAILGMRKREISKKFDEIVDFAGIERYIDTPVKRYSSGMYVRLAFAVAAHLESETLIVDEVLAVGDVEFQKRCLGKMGEVSKGEGRTVLFVSHQLGNISQLCDSTILLEQGTVAFKGDTTSAIDLYLNNRTARKNFEMHGEVPSGSHYFEKISLKNERGEYTDVFTNSNKIILEVVIFTRHIDESVELAISLKDRKDERIFTIHEPLREIIRKDNELTIMNISISDNFITPGRYSWIAALHIPHIQSLHLLESVCDFQIIDSGTQFSSYEGVNYGHVFPQYKMTYHVV